jgi:ribosomal protein S18 acetylase RimI-like enzyme
VLNCGHDSLSAESELKAALYAAAFVFTLTTNSLIGVDMDISLRVADVADEAFLLTLYASTRADEVARVNWTAQQKGAFVQMQFNAQRQYYLSQYPRAEYFIIEQNRRPIGRMIVDRSKHAILLMNIALLPEHRNKGLGTSLMEQLLEEADRAIRPVQIHVEALNPAKRLYRRLGFVETGEVGIYLEMTRQPKVGAYA